MNMKLIRGTTPRLNFLLPFDSTAISQIYLTFMQNGERIVQYDMSQLDIEPVGTEMEDSSITDANHGDYLIVNDIDYNPGEDQEQEVYCNCAIDMSEEDTLKFTFYPAAEKNIAYSQFKICTDSEVFVSDPINFRIYGDLDGKVRLI